MTGRNPALSLALDHYLHNIINETPVGLQMMNARSMRGVLCAYIYIYIHTSTNTVYEKIKRD